MSSSYIKQSPNDKLNDLIRSTFNIAFSKSNPALLSTDIIPSPIGDLIAIANDAELLYLDIFEKHDAKIISKIINIVKSNMTYNPDNSIIKHLKVELYDYFHGHAKIFNTPVRMIGTDFQKKTWSALLKIKYGERKSYSEQTNQINACRAVGNANAKNPLLILIPCHRVTRSDGTLGGFRGGTKTKKWLLEHEAKNTV